VIETRLINSDASTGITRYMHYDHDLDQIRLETIQHMDPIAEENIRRRNEDSDWGPNKWKGDQHMVGHLPSVVCTQLARRGILDDPEAFAKWFNSSEADPWRAKTGSIPLR
jgi:hypothetical protein